MKALFKRLLIGIFFLQSIAATAQSVKDSLTGSWKSYLKDKITFEFLSLNPDGTGLKCHGQTINGKDTLFESSDAAQKITHWDVKNTTLVLDSKNTAYFKANPVYKIRFVDSYKLELTGENLLYFLDPSDANRKYSYRTITYEKVGKQRTENGVKASTCITDEEFLSFKPIDQDTHLALYKGFDDLIPRLIACKIGFSFAEKYHDPPYRITVPNAVNTWSVGFGNNSFYISLNTDEKNKSETSIVIYYDFENEMRDLYFSDLKNGKEKKDVIKKNGFDIYKRTNWQGKFEGDIYLGNFIVVAYYTKDKQIEDLLQKCITSFRYD